jgi:hypothetical protein
MSRFFNLMLALGKFMEFQSGSTPLVETFIRKDDLDDLDDRRAIRAQGYALTYLLHHALKVDN